jgi:hypothetical protein
MMNAKDHERARTLLRAALVEGIAEADRVWIEAHLARCEDCSKEARGFDHAVRSLRSVRAAAPDELVRRTMLAVHRRAAERRASSEPSAFLWVAAVMCSAWTIVVSPYAWSVLAWLGRAFELPDLLWQLVFLSWWFMPATALGIAAGAQRTGERYE